MTLNDNSNSTDIAMHCRTVEPSAQALVKRVSAAAKDNLFSAPYSAEYQRRKSPWWKFWGVK